MIRRVSGVMLDPDAADFLVRALEMLAEFYKTRGGLPSAKLVEVTEQLRSGAIADVSRLSAGGDARFVAAELNSAHDPFHAVLDSRRVADILGISPNGARDLARRGTLPARHSGRQWLFDAAAVIRRAESRSG